MQSTHYYDAQQKETVADRYTILDRLGCGRFSTVYRAEDLKCDRHVALKIFRASAEFYETYQNEISLVDQMQGQKHPNIVDMLDHFDIETDDSVHGCIVYELLKTDVKKVLEDKGGFPLATALQIFKQVVAGISFLHTHNIIHADIKPENLLFTEDGQVKVCDIGSGVRVGEVQSFRIGTVPYLAPELILGVIFDTKADVWSLACLLFELVTSECIFDPEIYFKRDEDTDSESSSSGSDDDSRPSSTDDDSTASYSQDESSDDEDSDGIEFEMNHFQLAAFRSILGRVPKDIYRHGRYYSMYFDGHGRLRAVPRCIDHRSICDVLSQDFEIKQDDAHFIESIMLKMLLYDPEQRPTCDQVSAWFV